MPLSLIAHASVHTHRRRRWGEGPELPLLLASKWGGETCRKSRSVRLERAETDSSAETSGSLAPSQLAGKRAAAPFRGRGWLPGSSAPRSGRRCDRRSLGGFWQQRRRSSCRRYFREATQLPNLSDSLPRPHSRTSLQGRPRALRRTAARTRCGPGCTARRTLGPPRAPLWCALPAGDEPRRLRRRPPLRIPAALRLRDLGRHDCVGVGVCCWEHLGVGRRVRLPGRAVATCNVACCVSLRRWSCGGDFRAPCARTCRQCVQGGPAGPRATRKGAARGP